MNSHQIVDAADDRCEMVKAYFINNGIPLPNKVERVPYGIIPKIAKEKGYPVKDIRYSINRLKAFMPCGYVPTGPEVPERFVRYEVTGDSGKVSKMAMVALEDNLKRGVASLEIGACDTIGHALLDKLPPGGFGIYIGTPALFCASESDSNNMLLDDNLEVYIMLKNTTTDDYPLVVIGGIVNPEKANVKAEQFKRTQSSHNSKVMVVYLDANEFYDIIREECLKPNRPLVKVVFQASGIWSFSSVTQAKYPGLNLNFKDAAKKLTSEFSNLHILAMVREMQFGFDIRYLHNGDDVVLPRWKHPSIKD